MEDGNSNGMNMIGFGATTTTNNNNNNDGNVSNSMELMMMVNGRRAHRHFPLSNTTTNNSATSTVSSSLNMLKEVNNSSASPSCFMENNSMMLRAKILSHPHFPRLLAAYANCQKVGAPPQVVERLEQACGGDCGGGNIGEDPALDQFMEAYCEMLIKYEEELSKPIKEAMFFLSRIQYQLNALTSLSSLNNNSSPVYGDFTNRTGSSEGEVDATTDTVIDPQAEDKELKGQLLRRYGGHLGSLNQEFLKKKKKGKLPKEARQLLLDWWRTHYKWPYPSESQKVALAEATSLDQKQINNWFINQRKRHWKPTDDSMPCVAMDGTYAHYYLENVNMGSAFPMDYAPPGY